MVTRDSAAPAHGTTAPDPRRFYERAAAQLATLIASVRPAQLADATPCEAYDVGALLRHVVDGTLRMAAVGEGAAVERAGGESTDQGTTEESWPTAYAQARERVAAAWADDAKLDTVVSVPWGDVPGRLALAGAVMETVTHTWDLAQALGWRDVLDEELGGFALGVAQQAVTAERRGAGVPFGPVQPAPEGADVYGELAAWLGRSRDRALGGVRD